MITVVIVALATVGVFFGSYRLFWYQKAVVFSYSQPVCFADITPFPRLFSSATVVTYKAQLSREVRIAGYPVAARTTCIEAADAPKVAERHAAKLGIFGNSVVAKRYIVTAAKRPAVASMVALDKPLAINDSLVLPLDSQDKVFSYVLQVAAKTQPCAVWDKQLSCNVAALGLEQGKEYQLKVQQYFKAKPVAEIVSKTVKTALPVHIAKSSIPAQAVVYDKPGRITLQADQALTSVDLRLEMVAGDGKRTLVPTKTELAGADLAVVFAKPLDRNAKFELVVASAKSKDNGFLEKPYVLPFTVSGGPQVQRINIGSRSVSQYASLAVTFDQPLKPGADYSKSVTLTGSGAVVAATVSASGNVLTIRPQTAFGLCSKINVRINGEISSNYDISGNVSWSYGSRAVCHTISSIGSSVKGRPIQAYRFGSGASKVLYLGTTHGDERGTKSLLDTWINELEANPDRIPAGRSIIVIPSLNPDGYAANSRRNANNIDLNRNFPAYNWKSDVVMPGGQLQAGGGGSKPLSEPESQAIAQLIQAERPRLTLTYHSVGAVVQPNGAGDSTSLASTYAASSRYYTLAPGVNPAFEYDTTGAFEDWMYDKLSLPALLIELSSHNSSDWSRNSGAMWKMAQLP